MLLPIIPHPCFACHLEGMEQCSPLPFILLIYLFGPSLQSEHLEQANEKHVKSASSQGRTRVTRHFHLQVPSSVFASTNSKNEMAGTGLDTVQSYQSPKNSTYCKPDLTIIREKVLKIFELNFNNKFNCTIYSSNFNFHSSSNCLQNLLNFFSFLFACFLLHILRKVFHKFLSLKFIDRLLTKLKLNKIIFRPPLIN